MIKRSIEKQIFFNKYKLQKLIHTSEFSKVYKGINIINKDLVSIKIENRISIYNILESEAYILFMLKGFGIPNLISYGKSGKYNILVEELLGPSLEEILKLKQIKNGFPIKDLCMIALQGIDRLEYIHSKNIIHRDIKPHNFLIGRKEPTIIYLIDFGFAKKYKSSRTGKFIKFTNLGLFFGSLAYSSINANSGYQQCRRDDLESFGYMLVSLAKKKDLPWIKIGIQKNKKDELNEVCKLKKEIKLEKLCEGLPEEFIDYIKYCRKLEFEQEPNYNYLRNLFISILIKENQKNDLKFFWINKKTIRSVSKNNENNYIMRRETHKRLYNTVKNSLEKKRKERINNNLKSDCSKSYNSLDKVKDFQNNKKKIPRINLVFKNLNIKSSYDKPKISMKNCKTNNNTIEKTFTTPRNDEQKYNSYLKNSKFNEFISKNALYYNLKNQPQTKKIKLTKNISGNIRLKNILSNSNQNIINAKNIISKNYCNLEDNTNNNYQNKIININNYYYKEIDSHTPSNKYRYIKIPEIHYMPKYRNIRLLENKNISNNNSVYSLQNNSSNIRIQYNKNTFNNYSPYSFQNNTYNIRIPNNKNKFGNHSIYSFQNYENSITTQDNKNKLNI